MRNMTSKPYSFEPRMGGVAEITVCSDCGSDQLRREVWRMPSPGGYEVLHDALNKLRLNQLTVYICTVCGKEMRA